MKIEVDQSIKLENTNKPTYIAFSNSTSRVIVIPAREKKKIQAYFRKIGKPRLYIFLTFAAAIFLLLKNHIKNEMIIMIDKEYPGYEKFINQKLREFILQNSSKDNFRIYSSLIGKKSRAHIIVYNAFLKKSDKSNNLIMANDIIKIIEKNMKKSGIA